MFHLKVAARSLARQPSFLAAAVAALALGIAAPTALFAVVQATLLRPLPYPNASDIYTVRTTMTDGRFTIGLVASEELLSLRRSTDLVVGSAMYQRVEDGFATADGRDTTRIATVIVSEGFFDLFGVPMARGRAFNPADFERQIVRRAILSGRAWRSHFNADPAIVGQTIRLLTGGTVLVVGIAPDAFDAPHDTDLWVATYVSESIGHNFDAYVRVKPGARIEAVQASLGPMWTALGEKYPDMAKHRIFVFRPLLSSIVGDLGPTALMAFAATGVLLLLAVANVANLLLARGAARARDLAVRLAIGARWSHLIREQLAESTVIAVAAAAVGIPLASGAVRTIGMMGGSAFPRADGLRFDLGVALFAAGVMALAAVAVGLLPALTARDAQLTAVTNERGRGGLPSGRTRRLLGALVVSEITLAIVLVAGAGRLAVSAKNLLAVDPGFSAEGRLIVDAALPGPAYARDEPKRNAWSAEIEQRLRALGATHVGMATSLPLRREVDFTTFTDIVGRPVEPQLRPNGRLRVVNPEFFDSLGVRVSRGRSFGSADRMGTEPVVMVNEAWVAKFLPTDADPVRERITNLFVRPVDGKPVVVDAPIIGVVTDVRYASLDRSPEPVIYTVDTQWMALRRSYVLTAADGQPERWIPQIREVFRAVDPLVSVQFDSMPAVVSASLVWSRLGILLLGTFALVSLVLAGAGVFGVMAFVSAQRHGEMALRLSLGATRASVFRMMLAQGVRFTLIGCAIGTVLSWWAGRLMSSYVFEVSAANAAVLIGSAVVVGVVAIAAAAAPARRAAAVEPSQALRA